MKLQFVPFESISNDMSDLILKWRNSEDIRCQMIHQNLITNEEHYNWYKLVSSGRANYRVKMVYFDDMPIGVVYLTNMDLVVKCVSWGLYIGENKYRGLGLGRIMMVEILSWGFEELYFYRMYTSVLENNIKALSMYYKFGFKNEGIWEKHVLLKNGNRINLIYLGMCQEDWIKNREWILKILNDSQ